MNKLKLFFLSLLLGFSGLCGLKMASPVNNDVNTMIQNQHKVVLKETTDYVSVKKILFVNIDSIDKAITVGSTRTIRVSTASDSSLKPTEPSIIAIPIRTDNKKESNAVVISTLTLDPEKPGDYVGTISGTNNGQCTIQFKNIKGELIDSSELDPTQVNIMVKPYETISNIIENILSSNTIIIFIISVAATVIGRTAIKIFRYGVNYKSNFATVEDQKRFEDSMRNELRNSKSEIQDNLLKICLREINRETKPVKELQKIAENMKSDRQILDVKLDAIDEKYNEIKRMTESYNRLEAKVNRIQYGEATQDVRRVGK